ncbi:MAG: hypothetical protein JOY66_24040 [Acetobacteraceae bacterium]|nr:hypothetical protein [Acetobacteraceae bacterium]
MSEAAFAPFRVQSKGLAETLAFPDTPIERLRTGVAALRRTASLARALAESGRPIDLAGLDGQVGLVCARALDLPPEEGRLVRGELQALLSEVDALAASLRLTLVTT